MFKRILKSCCYGYVRVSSKSQALEYQKKGFQKRISICHGSPVFYNLIENDLLVVTKIDRCHKNTLNLPYSNDMAVNQLIATIATFENERRKERQRQGIQAANKAGKYRERKTVITKKVKDLKETKNLSIT